MPSFPLPSPLRLPWSKAAFSAPQAQSRRPIPRLSHLFDEIAVRRWVRRNLAGSFPRRRHVDGDHTLAALEERVTFITAAGRCEAFPAKKGRPAMLNYDDLVELARLCAATRALQRAETSRMNFGGWRRNIRRWPPSSAPCPKSTAIPSMCNRRDSGCATGQLAGAAPASSKSRWVDFAATRQSGRAGPDFTD